MNLPPPAWLKTFEAAARLGSFSAAADELGLTPAAVSQQMRLLEQHLKTTLFERLPRGVALTDKGAAYAQPVRKGLDDIHSATANLFGKAKRKQIRARVTISCAALILAPRLHEFHEMHPDIDVELSTFVWANRFEDGISDLDIRFGYGDWTDGQVLHLGHEFAVAICSPQFLASFGKDPAFEDLVAKQLYMIHGSETDWPELFQQLGRSMPSDAKVTHVDSSLLALQAVSTGTGVAIVLESFAQPFIDRGQAVLPVKDKLTIPRAHFIVTRDGAERREEVRAFSDWVKSIYVDFTTSSSSEDRP